MDAQNTTNRTPLDWPLIIVLALPWFALYLGVSTLWLQHAASVWQQQQSAKLESELKQALSSPASTASQQALSHNLRQVEFSSARLLDKQGATLWQSGPLTKRIRLRDTIWDGPQAAQVRLQVARNRHLWVSSPRATRAQRHRWRRQLGVVVTIGFVSWLAVCSLSYALASSSMRRLLSWSQELEQGQLDKGFSSRGLSGAIAQSVSSIARRLKYARSTLQELKSGEKKHTDSSNELQAQLARAENLLQQRGTLFANLNHELRTPLTGILGFTDLLQRSTLNEQQRDFVGEIQKSSTGMVELISDFLDSASADAGQLEIRRQALNIADIVEDTVSLLAPRAYEKNLELLSIVDHDLPVTVEGDGKRLAQILKNLVSNAVKYTDDGHVLIRVEQTKKQADTSWLRFRVEDSGRGLSEEQQQRLFQAFQRFDSESKERVEGTGLGLGIVRQLTEILGGTIEVHSQPEHGSEFSVSIPFKILAGNQIENQWDALEHRRIWLSEETPVASRALTHLLNYWRVQLHTQDTLAAMKRALKTCEAQDCPELIVLGLQPKQLGNELLTHIINIAAGRSIPVLIQINSVDAQTINRLERLGASRVLSKSAPRHTLYQALYQALADDIDAQHALSGRTIVLAEDNLASQQYLSTILQELGATVLRADDGNNALKLWRQHQPDFMLVDYNMPQADGKTLTREVRATPYGKDCIIVGTSAYLNPEQERQWFEAGLDAFLIKPFDQNQFLRCVQPWLGSAVSKPNEHVVETSAAARLVEDPELAALMLEELPKQAKDLDSAFVLGDWDAARAAAHQLHGTAAFFHLEPLKTHVHAMESRLTLVSCEAHDAELRNDMAKVTADVSAVLAQLTKESS